MARKSKAQIDKLITLLEDGKSVSIEQAEKRGVNRVPARIYDLRNLGWTIYTNKVAKKGRTVTCYRASL
jgi:hypothetical protein